MLSQLQISSNIASRIGDALGIDWTLIDRHEFHRGLELEVEREWRSVNTDVSHHDLALTGRLVWRRIRGCPDYYTRLDGLDAEIEACYAHFGVLAIAGFAHFNEVTQDAFNHRSITCSSHSSVGSSSE